jgi:DNA polymerase III delta prime subunit
MPSSSHKRKTAEIDKTDPTTVRKSRRILENTEHSSKSTKDRHQSFIAEFDRCDPVSGRCAPLRRPREGIDTSDIAKKEPCRDVFIRCRVKKLPFDDAKEDALIERVVNDLASRSGAPDHILLELSYFFQRSVKLGDEIVMLVRCNSRMMSPFWTADVVSESLVCELDDKPLFNLHPMVIESPSKANVTKDLIEYVNSTPFSKRRMILDDVKPEDLRNSTQAKAKLATWCYQYGFTMTYVTGDDPDPDGEFEIPVLLEPIELLRSSSVSSRGGRATRRREGGLDIMMPNEEMLVCCSKDDNMDVANIDEEEEYRGNVDLERVISELARTNPTSVVKIRDALKEYSTTRSKKRREWLDFVTRIPVGNGSLANFNALSLKEDVTASRDVDGSLLPNAGEILLTLVERELDAVVHGMYGARNFVMEIAGRSISAALSLSALNNGKKEKKKKDGHHSFAEEDVVNTISPSLRAILLEGPPGCGKTTFATRAMGSALRRPVRVINVGGAKDASTLIGHSYTYDGSRPGRIMEEIVASGVIDPIIVFDEVDKISDTNSGHEIVNVLMSMVDPAQHHAFTDTYLAGVPVDLSGVMVVMTCNDSSLVNRILLDRVRIVHVPSPTSSEYLTITKNYVFPRTLKNYGFLNNAGPLSDEMARALVRETEMDAHKENNAPSSGMRGIEKLVERVVLNANLRCIRENSHELTVKEEDLANVSRMMREENRLAEECSARVAATKGAFTSMYT